MRKYMLCAMLGLAAGCAEPTASTQTVATSGEENANATALVEFHCPGMT